MELVLLVAEMEGQEEIRGLVHNLSFWLKAAQLQCGGLVVLVDLLLLALDI